MEQRATPDFAEDAANTEPRWYTIHTYAGYENAVERNLKQRIESLGMENKIFEVVVPTEKKIRVKGGKRIVEEEKIYPGYILVRMIVDEDSWFVVRNTPRVTGFVGSGVTPVPMEEGEVAQLMKRMDAEAPKHRIDLSKDDLVAISAGFHRCRAQVARRGAAFSRRQGDGGLPRQYSLAPRGGRRAPGAAEHQTPTGGRQRHRPPLPDPAVPRIESRKSGGGAGSAGGWRGGGSGR